MPRGFAVAQGGVTRRPCPMLRNRLVKLGSKGSPPPRQPPTFNVACAGWLAGLLACLLAAQ